jgi:predicted Zn-ribbon and HTH transcriptional regulator
MNEDDDYEEPVWVCESCGWEGDPDRVGSKCPGCGREIGDDEP